MLLKEALNETTYMASMAELYGEIFTNDVGLEILVSGFSHKSLVLLETMILTYFSPNQYVNDSNLNRYHRCHYYNHYHYDYHYYLYNYHYL